MNSIWNGIDADLSKLRDAGQYKLLKNLIRPMGPVSAIEGVGEVVVLCSNDYLGLANHPQVVESAIAAQKKWGAGTASVRFICGTFDYHRELEKKLSSLSGTEAATTYVSCWNANEAVLATLMAVGGDGVTVISDELNHASIIDAIRLGRQINKQSRSAVYRHSDMTQLEERLKEFTGNSINPVNPVNPVYFPPTIVVTDGVFSMEGDIAKLDEIHRLCAQYGAMLMVDDSHGVGVCGPTGLGVAEHYGLHGKIDCLTGTLGKALGGAAGGYVASRAGLIDLMIQKSRPQIFSNALPPGTAGAASKAIDLLRQDKTLVEKLRGNVKFMRQGLKKLGFGAYDNPSAITPIILGPTAKAIAASKRLLELGVFVIGFGYPVVPEGTARLRVQVSAAHQPEHLQKALDAFARL